jgi:hypothetical protein
MIRASEPGSCRRCTRWEKICSHALPEQPGPSRTDAQKVSNVHGRFMAFTYHKSDPRHVEGSTPSQSDSDSEPPTNCHRRSQSHGGFSRREFREVRRRLERLEEQADVITLLRRRIKKLEKKVAVHERSQQL